MAVPVVSGVVTRLSDLLAQEAIYLYGVSDKAHELQTELIRIQCFLKDADAKQNQSAFAKNSVAEMIDLAYDAEDVIATYALTVASGKGRGIQKVLKRCACILNEGITVHQVGSKIDTIKRRISNLKESFVDYGIAKETIQAGGPSSMNEPQPEQRKTSPDHEDDPVGFTEDLDRLVKILLNEDEDTRVASIYGMGGLGKTTLARMVYNDPRVEEYFKGGRAWACVSQQCQNRPVWEEIMINLLPKEEIVGWPDRKLTKKLCEVLQKQKCLVVLDDIWKIEDWINLREAFPVNDTRSKILLTSRKKDVASLANARGVHKLGCLNQENCLELFTKKAISWRSATDPVRKIYTAEVGKKMIEYCGGLPLAIAVLGGLLATKQTSEEWDDVHKHVKLYLNEAQDLQVNKVLALSYKDLPSHLKPCFLCLGYFPEGFEIPAKEMIRMWMGEGFISQIQYGGGREETMDDVGHRYLKELVQRCMVLVGKKSSLGRIKTCRIHDLMRDFCISKVQEENFFHFTNTLSMKQRKVQIGKVRRLAIILKSGENSIKGIKFNEYPYLRSLLHLLPKDTESYFSESRFKKFKLVRVLHLEYFKNHSRKLPKDIGCLIHLRYLSLKGSNIVEVPSSIGNLRCLETLDLRIELRSRVGLRVPNVFKYMKQLKHLYLPLLYKVRGMLELANLSYLQTLVNVQPKTIQIPTWFELDHLRVLKVRSVKCSRGVVRMLISRCRHVEKLNLYCSIKKLPEAHQLSPNLAKLIFGATELDEHSMQTLGKLPNLKILQLWSGSILGKRMDCSRGGFPKLHYLFIGYLGKLEDLRVEEGAMPSLCHLEINWCQNLVEWRVEEGAMPSLCRLEIGSCKKLKTIPDGLRFVTTLRDLRISYMPNSFKDRLCEGGPDFDKVKHMRSLVFHQRDGE